MAEWKLLIGSLGPYSLQRSILFAVWSFHPLLSLFTFHEAHFFGYAIIDLLKVQNEDRESGEKREWEKEREERENELEGRGARKEKIKKKKKIS